MLTETLSGKCPCCGFDKLIQRYGSQGYYQLDGCVSCGFGYGSNGDDHDPILGFHQFRDFAIYMLASHLASIQVPYPEVLKKRLKEHGSIKCGDDTDYKVYQKEWDEVYAGIHSGLVTMDDLLLRRRCFDYINQEDRCTDVDTTIFSYTESDIEQYRKTNPVIFHLMDGPDYKGFVEHLLAYDDMGVSYGRIDLVRLAEIYQTPILKS